jgi:anti-sigma factor RsiW
MTDTRKSSPEGWESSQILAYIEGDLDQAPNNEFESHLRECSFCAAEYQTLRHLNSLLKTNPEVFHPNDDELYAFASRKTDPEGQIASHLEWCSRCAEDVRTFEQMLEVRADGHFEQKMPQAIERQIELLQGTFAGPATGGFWPRVSDLLKKPFAMPVLSLASAAAALILAVLIIPSWEEFKKIPQPAEVSVAKKAGKPMGQVLESRDRNEQTKGQDLKDTSGALPQTPRTGSSP